jgi:decaprenylphospho-beta-D-erythro-pentofuranosid-2-ulose 2-reductase
MQRNWKHAIVVGASGGIGEQLVRKLTARGCKVALVGRREDKLRHISTEINGASLNLAHPFAIDITDFASAEEHFDRIVRELGGLDIIIFAAGVMPKITPTEYDIDKDKLIVDTNLISAIAWLNPAAKRFERAKSGTIVGIGSPSGDRGRRGNPAYGASKAGLECYLESLRNRLSQHNVNVVTVKPGPVATEMTKDLGKQPFMVSADYAAEKILHSATKFGKTVYIPWIWWLIMKVVKSIPSFIFRKMKF